MIALQIDLWSAVLLFLAGLALGTFYYGGLWLTIEKGFKAPYASLWFMLSMLLRNVGVVAAFFFLSGGEIGRLLICLLGFVAVRFLFSHSIKPQIGWAQNGEAP